jgi:AcrR family transcriptional regulator
MSGNITPLQRKTDARVIRRRNMLGDALVELMVEKRFDEITVQDVLDRAKVSRSTFYAHYCDKDDLFLSDVEDFWDQMSGLLERQNDRSTRLAPVRELFSHIAEASEFYSSMVASGKIDDVRSIRKRITMVRKVEMETLPHLTALSFAYAGALFALLTWWVDQGMKPAPEVMDAIYNCMVFPVEKDDGASNPPA